LGRKRRERRKEDALKTGMLKEKTQDIFSVVLSNGVYVRRRIFEWPDIRKCYSVRIS
jgi:hypothetical protein